MGTECGYAPVGTKHGWCDLFPERRTSDVHVEDVVDGYGVGRHRAARIDQKRTGLAVEPPHSVIVPAQVLPPDFTDIIRTVPARLKIDDPDAGMVQLHAAIIDGAAPITIP